MLVGLVAGQGDTTHGQHKCAERNFRKVSHHGLRLIHATSEGNITACTRGIDGRALPGLFPACSPGRSHILGQAWEMWPVERGIFPVTPTETRDEQCPSQYPHPIRGVRTRPRAGRIAPAGRSPRD